MSLARSLRRGLAILKCGQYRLFCTELCLYILHRLSKYGQRSETSLCRERLIGYCTGAGLDLGFGGDPITDNAITVDLPKPYVNFGSGALNLPGDARDLHWFRDGVLDYVYSSHLLEDFADTYEVLREWLRVIKKGGQLVLYLPDVKKYRQYCSQKGERPNPHHAIEDFNLEYVKRILMRFDDVEIVYSNPSCDSYSFEIVVRKK